MTGPVSSREVRLLAEQQLEMLKHRFPNLKYATHGDAGWVLAPFGGSAGSEFGLVASSYFLRLEISNEGLRALRIMMSPTEIRSRSSSSCVGGLERYA